jgi:hypothetical protein
MGLAQLPLVCVMFRILKKAKYLLVRQAVSPFASGRERIWCLVVATTTRLSWDHVATYCTRQAWRRLRSLQTPEQKKRNCSIERYDSHWLARTNIQLVQYINLSITVEERSRPEQYGSMHIFLWTEVKSLDAE